MTALIEFREKLKIIYGRYSIYILPVLKFLLALVVFIRINNSLGFMELLKNPFVVIILSLLCAIMPVSSIAVVAGIMVVVHCYALGIEIAAFAIILFLIMMILYLRFTPRSSFALLITPLAFGFNIPSTVPIGYGLLGNPGSALSVGCGVITYYFIKFVSDQATVLQSTGVADIPKKITLLLDGIVKNQNMMISMITCVAVVLLVYLIHRLSINYAWRIAIVVGSLTYLIFMMGAGFFMNMDNSVIGIMIGTIVSIIVSLILEFFVFHVDYSRMEQYQYEDDEYYYYIKALPKVSITKSERDIKNISRDSQESTKGNLEKERSVNAQTDRLPEIRLSSNMQTGMLDYNPIENQINKQNQEKINMPEIRVESDDFSDIDFEKKLEESLKNL